MLCFACVFCGHYGMHHTVGHYQLAVKCVEVCTVSAKELPSSSITSVTYLVWARKVFCTLGICSWWRSESFFFLECFSSYYVNSLAVSGPATIHRLSAVSVMPITPPVSLHIAFSCSWTWSCASAENLCVVFCVTKLPLMNCAWVVGQLARHNHGL